MNGLIKHYLYLYRGLSLQSYPNWVIYGRHPHVKCRLCLTIKGSILRYKDETLQEKIEHMSVGKNVTMKVNNWISTLLNTNQHLSVGKYVTINVNNGIWT